ncbi:hypothetical protein B0T19DRAFT_253271 [Cercophora scortea]|uniref:Uncharacterized protein n=1 Tax=Cercophora scortea TaxID=314031 RepID=A0AAE0M718_9PEZI|nr:hypothetical protein B0T19DRAFT_253271 [Cercophora scortea]
MSAPGGPSSSSSPHGGDGNGSGSGSGSTHHTAGSGSNLPRQLSTQPRLSLSKSSANDGGDPAFTPQMRDRQARGKDPSQSTDGSEDNSDDLSDNETDVSLHRRMGGRRIGKEDFAAIERRQTAIAFLENPELLMMYAQSTGDSITGARYHFTKMMCGYNDIDEKQQKPPTTTTTSASTSGKPASTTARGGGLLR